MGAKVTVGAAGARLGGGCIGSLQREVRRYSCSRDCSILEGVWTDVDSGD